MDWLIAKVHDAMQNAPHDDKPFRQARAAIEAFRFWNMTTGKQVVCPRCGAPAGEWCGAPNSGNICHVREDAAIAARTEGKGG